VFLVHSGQVGWSVIADLLDQGVGVGGAVGEKYCCKSVDDTWDGFSVECRASGKWQGVWDNYR
jgi:hypothetical protein